MSGWLIRLVGGSPSDWLIRLVGGSSSVSNGNTLLCLEIVLPPMSMISHPNNLFFRLTLKKMTALKQIGLISGYRN